MYHILRLRYGFEGPKEDADRCEVCIYIDRENTLQDHEQQEKKDSVYDLKRLLTGKQIDPDAGCIYYLVPKCKWAVKRRLTK